MSVQPQEPVTGESPPPTGAETPVAAPVKKPRNRRLRLWLALGAGVVALLCLGGVGVAVLLYDDETKIVRENPTRSRTTSCAPTSSTATTRRPQLYQCKSGGDFAEILADCELTSPVESKQFSIGIRRQLDQHR